MELITKWSELNLKDELLRGIYSYGFEEPSPIQGKSILPITSGKDIIAQAQSGTGKTGAFSISMLQRIDENKKEPQGLIMAPTRELALQIHKVVENLGRFLNISCKLLIGGNSIDQNISDLESMPHILIGTPGRVHDLIRRKKLNSKTIKMLVLDEADDMLSTGFKDQIYSIFQHLSNDIQIVLFSATLPTDILQLTSKFMRDPINILVKKDSVTLEGIKQYYVAIDDDHQKYETLKDLYASISVSQCIIYCNSIKRVKDLYEALIKDSFPVCQIHSEMDKSQRESSYQEFVNGGSRVLISTNLTARGIDVQQVSTVINFDLPKDIHTYIHRIGRSGRWGRKGLGINLVTRRDIRNMKEIESYYETQIDELPSSFGK
jgi:translation initiation factor 4A